MKVQNNSNRNLSQVDAKSVDTKKGKLNNSPEASLITSGDKNSAGTVSLSTRAQDMKKIKSIVDSTPDIDEAKVAHYQKLIESGQYKVDSKAIADRMVDEHLNWDE